MLSVIHLMSSSLWKADLASRKVVSYIPRCVRLAVVFDVSSFHFSSLVY